MQFKQHHQAHPNETNQAAKKKNQAKAKKKPSKTKQKPKITTPQWQSNGLVKIG
jgi:hypothetical protein